MLYCGYGWFEVNIELTSLNTNKKSRSMSGSWVC
jgi:hypothetical protein